MKGRVAALVGEGRLRPQVGKIMPFAQAADAHRMSESGHARGKLVLTMKLARRGGARA